MQKNTKIGSYSEKQQIKSLNLNGLEFSKSFFETGLCQHITTC